MDEGTKKTLLYGGGAIASIVALVYIFKGKGGQSVSIPTGSGGASGGASNNQTEAARINAATQLAIAQGAQDLQKQDLAAKYGLGIATIQGSVDVAKINANSAAMRAALGNPQLAGAAGGVAGTATKGLFDVLKELFSPTPQSGSVNPEHIFPPSDTYPTYASPGVYSATGNLLDADNPSATLADYYMGTTGSGSSDYFGSSPTDFVGQPFATSWQDYYSPSADQSSADAPAAGYSDYTPEETSALAGD